MVFKITDVGNKSTFWDVFPTKVESKTMKQGVSVSIKNAKLLEDTRLDYSECINLFTNIANQILSLEKKGWMIPYLSLKDILVFENRTYAYIGVNKIIRAEEVDLTLGKGDFLSPEITDKKTYEVSKRSGWYSLAVLVSFYLTGKKNNPLKHLQSIYGTKLYWALKRCLEEKAEDRSLLVL
jgi:hypothetical protein